MTQIGALVLDLDGVVRHFDDEFEATLARNAGLEPGSIAAAAYEEQLLHAVTTGAMTKAQWIERVGIAIGHPEAALGWGDSPVTVDDEVLAIVDEVRATGVPVVILTNGTDTVPAELDALDLTRRFDRIFNSAEIGHAKPDTRAFAHVCAALDLTPERVAFTDDSPAKLAGATELGLVTHPFTSAPALRTWVVTLGLLP